MKEYRITTENLNEQSPDDCYLAPEDPIHKLKIASYLGGLGSDARLQEYNASLNTTFVGSNKGQIQREKNIKPGTEEWFKLWFGKQNEN